MLFELFWIFIYQIIKTKQNKKLNYSFTLKKKSDKNSPHISRLDLCAARACMRTDFKIIIQSKNEREHRVLYTHWEYF